MYNVPSKLEIYNIVLKKYATSLDINISLTNVPMDIHIYYGIGTKIYLDSSNISFYLSALYNSTK